MKKLNIYLLLILTLFLLGAKHNSSADTSNTVVPKLEPDFAAVDRIWSLPESERMEAFDEYLRDALHTYRKLNSGKNIAYTLPVLDKGLIDTNPVIRRIALYRFKPSLQLGENPAIFNQDKNRENIIRSLMHDESFKTREAAMAILLYYFPANRDTIIEAINVQKNEIDPSTRYSMIGNFERLYDFAPKEIRRVYVNEIMKQKNNEHLDRAATWAAEVIGRHNPPPEVMDMIASKSYGDRFNEKISQSFIDYGKDTKNPSWPVQKYMRTLQRMRNSILVGKYSTRHMSENDFKRQKKSYLRPIDSAIEKIEAME